MVEASRGREPSCVAGLLVQIGQHVVHAAELGAQHRLHLRGAQRAGAPVDPGGEGEQHVTGLGAADQAPDVQQAGQRLVDRVVGHVAVGQGALLERGEVRLGEPGEVSGAEPGRGVVGLAPGELGDHAGRLVPAHGVAGHRVRLRPGGEEVPLHVGAEGEGRSVPAAVRRRPVGGEPVVGAEVVQQPVDVDEPQVVQCAVLVVQPPARGQPDPAQLEGAGQDPDVGTHGWEDGGLRG
ncbi:hypothetical protein M2169_006296 [Streptomyces sp. MJP52]|nr:hypothetical protein [Streptomyces sp. MJP52]